MISMVLTSGLKNLYTSAYHEEYILDTPDDVASLVTDCAPGSIAYTADLGHIYILSPSREWVEVSDEGGVRGESYSFYDDGNGNITIERNTPPEETPPEE